MLSFRSIRLILLPLLFILSGSSVSGQTPPDSLNAFLNDHYEGGERAFLEHVYQTIKYPLAARESCGIGLLHVRLTLRADRGLSRITFLNNFGFGVEEDVTRILQASNDQWTGGGKPRQLEFSIGYQLGGSPEIKGDINVIGYTTGYSEAPSGCPDSKVLLLRLRKGLSKGKVGRVRKYYAELLRRGYRDVDFLDLVAEYGPKLKI